MLDRQDTLTIVALLVSLIALCIAVFQMLQASFLTAEGGRRCKSAIMGKWFILSRWKFVWSEFRFEVRFTTPEITLVDLHDTALQVVTPEDLSGDRKSRIFDARCQPQGKDTRRASHLLHWDTLPYRIEKMWTMDTQTHLLKDIWNNYKTTRWRWIITWIMDLWRVAFLQESDEDVMGDVDAMVSWDVFLRMNYMTQRYAMEIQARASRESYEVPLHEEKSIAPPHGTFVSVNLRQHTWDLMPPDVVRPLARSKLGTILILACRLDMEWHELNIEDRRFRAEGAGLSSGCTLSSRTIPGLGLVLEFNVSQIGTPILISPCKYADMMFHGIIPGCPNLNIPEARLVGDFRKTRLDWWFAQWKLSDKVPQSQKERPWWGRTLVNSLLALQCPFLPPKNSPLTRFPYPLPKEGMNTPDMYINVFRQWESRKVFILSLARVKKEQRFSASGNLNVAYNDLAYLEEHFEKDYYDFFRPIKKGDRLYFLPRASDYVQNPNVIREKLVAEGPDARNVVILGEKLREIHDRTTRYFEALLTADSKEDGLHESNSRQYDSTEIVKEKESSLKMHLDYNTPPRDGSKRQVLNYRDLVRAFIEILAVTIVSKHDSLTKLDKDLVRQGKNGGRSIMDINSASIMEILIDQIPAIVRKLRDTEYCPNGVQGLTDDQIEEAVWIMIVRGISWNMSVFWRMVPYERMIPSSLYDSQVPVWLM